MIQKLIDFEAAPQKPNSKRSEFVSETLEVKRYISNLRMKFIKGLRGDRSAVLRYARIYLGSHADTLYNTSWIPIVNDGGEPEFDMNHFMQSVKLDFEKLLREVETSYAQELNDTKTSEERAALFKTVREELGMTRK